MREDPGLILVGWVKIVILSASGCCLLYGALGKQLILVLKEVGMNHSCFVHLGIVYIGDVTTTHCEQKIGYFYIIILLPLALIMTQIHDKNKMCCCFLFFLKGQVKIIQLRMGQRDSFGKLECLPWY